MKQRCLYVVTPLFVIIAVLIFAGLNIRVAYGGIAGGGYSAVSETPSLPASGSQQAGPPRFDEVTFYLVALGEGRLGCGDALVPVTRRVEPTTRPLTTSLRELLAINERIVEPEGLMNALYQSELEIHKIELEDGKARIWLAGNLLLGGVCDAPRIEAQLEQTALQFRTIDEVDIFINNRPVETIGTLGPVVTVLPSTGPAGTRVRVTGTGFPVGEEVTLTVGQWRANPDAVDQIRVREDGRFTTEVTIPANARQDELWLVTAITEGPHVEVLSNVFSVNDAAPETGAIYTVQRGDRLSRIARRYDMTLGELLEANPQIVDPNAIYPGQRLFLPSVQPPRFEQVRFYVTRLGEGQVGCGDALVGVRRRVEPTTRPLTTSLRELLSLNEGALEGAGLYNALSQSNLEIEDIDLVNGRATIHLAGDLRLGGVCDAPRIKAQLEQTVLQFRTIDEVGIFVNDRPLDSLLSGRSEQ